jgi:uncharacterized protein YndB with AHSA1/START domain
MAGEGGKPEDSGMPSRRRPANVHSPEVAAGSSWTATTLVGAARAEVLEALTDPSLIAEWAPVAFELEHLDGRRLRSGTQARIRGQVAGIRSCFEVDVIRADDECLELRARGPVDMEVAYRLADHAHGTAVEASIELRRRRGVAAQLVRAAAAALLNEGALNRALAQLAGGLGACPAAV